MSDEIFYDFQELGDGSPYLGIILLSALEPSNVLAIANNMRQIEEHLGCSSCPLYQQDAPWEDDYIHPQLGQRRDNGTQIFCHGISPKGIKKIEGRLESLPCFESTKSRMVKSIKR